MDGPNLYFFTGENEYALEKELSRWKHMFASKHGPENMLMLRAKDVSVSDILDAVSTMPFIAEKRLVVLEGIPKIEKEDFTTIVESLHPQTVLVIAESKPDKRLGIVKEIEKAADKKNFAPFSPGELAGWIRAQAQESGSSIDAPAVKTLLAVVGDDPRMLAMEIAKLAEFAGADIRPEHIDILAVPSGDQVIWRLTDLIGSGKADEAMKFLENRLERGEDVYGMWVILLNMIKNLGLVSAAVASGLQGDRSIASAVGIHFFVVRGLLTLAKSMHPSRVRELVNWAADADIQLKTGGYHYSADRDIEVVTLAERAILMCK